MSLEVDNFLTEWVTGEVKDVVVGLSEINNIRRAFLWSEADQEKLNHPNAEAKTLQTTDKWTWAAKHGTDQCEYNHKQLQYFVHHELQTAVKHCDRCKSTGILVGLNQIDSAHCHHCVVSDINTRSVQVKI